MKVCRICLSKDGRLYPIASNGLRSLYHQLTGVLKLEMDIEGRLPQWVCAECGLRLLSYNKLRQKSLWSYNMLCQLLGKHTHITEDDINQIDRENGDLKSNLSYNVLDNGIVQQYEVNMQQTEQTDSKTELKIKEFTIDLEVDETEKTATVFKTEKDFFNESPIETAVSETENNLDLEIDPLSDCSSISNLEDDETYDSSKLRKPKDIKKDLDIKKGVDKYMNALMTKINEIKAKKAVKLTKKCKNDVDEKVVSKKNKDSIPLELRKRLVKKSKKDVANNQTNPIEDVFTVQILSLDEQIVEFEKRKYSKNYTHAPFKCSACFKGFYSETVFASHQIRHSDKFGSFECKICKLRFRTNTNSSYYQHMNSHKHKYNCNECQFKTNLRSGALKHWYIHKGKVFKCPHCTLQFVNQSSYFGHLRIQHVSQFACKFCGFSFVNAKGVALHIRLKHAIEKDSKIMSTDGPKCTKCNLTFVSDKALRTHIRVSHPKNINNKKRNTFDDGPNASIICEICGAKLSSGNAYRFHWQRYHPNENTPKSTLNIKCEQCGKGFQHKSEMLRHAAMHTGHKPYECDNCNKKFRTKFNVRQHILNQHLPKIREYPKERYTCDICGKEFSHSKNIKRHIMVSHSYLRPFRCEVCAKSFKTQSDVKTHTEHVHLKVPWPKRLARGRQRNKF